LAWARRMDLGPNPGENEEPGARLGRIPPSGCKKRPPEAKSGGRLEMILVLCFELYPAAIMLYI
jgi:hypothetical protein